MQLLRTKSLFAGDVTQLESICLDAGARAARNSDSPYSPEEACVNAAARAADRRADFMTRADAERQSQAAKEPFVGIGLELSRSAPTGPIRIVQPIAGSPAERSGLQPGDDIHEIDGIDISQMTLADGVRVMRGPAGSTMHLRIQRGKEAGMMEFSIPRERIRVMSVKARLFVQERVVYARISQFRDDTARQLLDAFVNETSRVLPRRLILDLRGNQGGLLDAIIAVGSLLVPPGTVFSHETDRYGKSPRRVPDSTILASGADPQILRELRSIPLTVLVNEKTASGAELLAQALYEVRDARTVGTASFGDDIIQQWMALPSGMRLRLTTATLTSASDWSWRARGVRIEKSARDSRPLEYGVLELDRMLEEELHR
jgi:carboxyl-terminal processing protease